MKSILFIVLRFFNSCLAQDQSPKIYSIMKTDKEWKELLSTEAYHVLREKGTERPNTGEYNLHFLDGLYKCAGCGVDLFESSTKFNSHCGWPAFDASIEGKVTEHRDTTHGMIRVEILCSNCGGHLGHVFPDGPTETGLRYCVNSLSLDFEEK